MIIADSVIPTADAVRVDISGPRQLVVEVLHNFAHHWRINPASTAVLRDETYADEPEDLVTATLLAGVKPFPGGLDLESVDPLLGLRKDVPHAS